MPWKVRSSTSCVPVSWMVWTITSSLAALIISANCSGLMSSGTAWAIACPGQPGASHSHDFFGNESANANATYDSMATAPSNCGVSTDTAGYWIPTPSIAGIAFHAKGNVGDMRIYYRLAGAQTVETIP